MDIVNHTIDASNVDRCGFFCYKSKPKSPGFREKRKWLDKTLQEGLRLKIIYEGNRSNGFIEYVPGEYAWRAVHAPGYLVIHCMWVVGSSKGKGYGWRLLDQVLSEAENLGMHGVVLVTSSSNWLAPKGFFLHHGFEVVDYAPPSFELLVRRFRSAPLPSFPNDWDNRLKRYPDGLVVYHCGQCPYHAMFISSLANTANQLGLPFQAIELSSSWEARTLSPSAYGVFGVVYNGQLISYRPMGGKTLRQILEKPNG